MKEDVASRLQRLPSFHPVALKLLTISTESETALGDFETCFESDPAFASELLQTANSVEFGLQGEVESIRHALILLGLERVSSLSFTLAMDFYMRNTPRRQTIHSVWSHSVASGLIAAALGEALRLRLPTLYTAGLMHDIGRLGLLMTAAGQYEGILIQVHADLDEATALEITTVGVTHAEAGALMAESWGIPVPICECIRHHHTVPESRPRLTELLDLVRLACRMATSLGYPEVACRQNERLHDAMKGVPAVVRAHPSLIPMNLTSRIKKLLGSVW